jgi:hypothetical protein
MTVRAEASGPAHLKTVKRPGHSGRGAPRIRQRVPQPGTPGSPPGRRAKIQVRRHPAQVLPGIPTTGLSPRSSPKLTELMTPVGDLAESLKDKASPISSGFSCSFCRFLNLGP